MGCGGRVNDEGLGVSHIGQVTHQFQGVDETVGRLGISLYFKAQHTPKALLQIFLRHVVEGTALQARIIDVSYPGWFSSHWASARALVAWRSMRRERGSTP